MNTIEIFLTSAGENENYTQNFSFAELIKDFPVYQNNYQNIVLNINIPTSILPDGYQIAGVTTDTMGAAVKVSASSLARNGAIRQSKSFYLRYLKTWTKDNVEYAMFQRPFPQTFALYAGQGENAPKLTINVVNIMNDTLEDPNPTVVSVITSQICSLEVMPSTILDKDAELDPSDLDEINARLSSIEEEQLIQNANISTNAEDIDSLEGRVGTNEDNIEELQEQVTALGGTPFTNEKLGLILGSSDNGKISANADGTGSVSGWETKLDKNLGDENSGKYLKVNNEGTVQPVDLNVKTLNTTNTEAQETSSNETILGSGTINLHKVAKTGTYSDLLSKPTLGTASALNTGTSQGDIPVLGANGKLPSSVVPASAITDTFVVSSQAEMLALSTAQVGDVCVRTDLNKSFILKAEPYSTLANWQELLTPTDAVLSVNGQTGAVSLGPNDVGAEPAFNKNTAFNQNFETSTSNIKMNGSVSVGSSNNVARADHVHPSDTSKQDTLISGTTIKTINNVSLLGSGDITLAVAQTDVQVDGTSVTSNNVADLKTKNADYNASTNKFVTENDLANKMDKANPTGTGTLSLNRKANTTVGDYSVTEGFRTTASALCSHAEGDQTTASGHASHAEGAGSEASGEGSHAEGVGTRAVKKAQHVFGKYNIADTTTNGYIEIVGNGINSNDRSNARTLDWSGNEVLSGTLQTTGLKDGNNANYKLALPNTTSWTADKTIATTDEFANKVDKTTSTNKIYATDNSGNQTTKSIMKLSSVDALGWEYGENHTKIPELSTLAYWNGAYEQQLSNLQYCKDGEIAPKSMVTPTAWQSATPNTTTLYSGTCEFCKVGKIVYCYIDNLVINSGISGGGSGVVELFTGLPTTNKTIIFILPQQTGGNGNDIRCKLDGGTISLHWSDTASFGNIGIHHNMIFSYVEA